MAFIGLAGPSIAAAQLTFTSTPQTVIEAGTPYLYRMTASFGGSPGEAPGVGYYATTLPSWLSFDGRNTLSGTPGTADIGEHPVTLIAVRRFSFQSQSFTIRVTPPDQPPSLPDPPPSLSMHEDTPLTLTGTMLSAVDEQPDALIVELQTPPSGTRYRVQGTDMIVPDADYHGPLAVPVRVRDSRAYSNTVTVHIDVLPVNDAPRIADLPQPSVAPGEQIVIELGEYVTDPEGDPLTFTASMPSDDFTLDAASGRFMMTAPAVADPVDRHIVFSVSDGVDSAHGVLTLALLGVGRADLAASIAVSDNLVGVEEPVTLTMTATHAGGNEPGRFEFEAQISASAPLTVDSPSDPTCSATAGGDATTIMCRWESLASGTSRAVEVPIRVSAAGEAYAAAVIRSLPGSPIDERAGNDRADVAWLIAADVGEGPSEQLPAPALAAIAAGDFDGDGLDDLAAAPRGSSAVQVYFNRIDPASGVRAFATAATPAGTAVQAVDLATHDLDGDGYDDIIVAAEDGRHRVLRSIGDNTFEELRLERGGTGTRSLTVIDVDGDGLDDLVFSGTSRRAGSVYRHLGALAFERRDLDAAGAALDVVGEHFGGTGRAGLVLLGSDDVHLLEAAEGGFGAPVALGIGTATSAAAADFDGDGAPDLLFGLTGVAGGAGAALYTNTVASGERFAPAGELTRVPARALLAADVDRDGTEDVIALGSNGVHRVFSNGGAAAFTMNPHLFKTDGAPGPDGFAAALGRFTNEERVDVAVTGPGSIAIFRNDGRGRFGRGDRDPPIVTLLGEEKMTVTIGQQYVDPGATASDEVDGDITDRITVTETVDVDVIGEYTVAYGVRDRAGNYAEATRSVEVRPRTEGGGGGGALGPWSVALLIGCAAFGVFGAPKPASAQLSYTYVDFRVVSNDVAAQGTQPGSGAQTVTLQAGDGDGVSVAGSVALPGRFYFLGAYSSSILDVNAMIESPLTEVQVTDEFDLTVSSIGFGYGYSLTPKLDLTVELARERAELDFGSLVGEQFDTSSAGAAARLGFRYAPSEPLEVYASFGQSPFAKTNLDTRSLDEGTTLNAGLRWYFLPDLGAGIDYRSGDLAAITLSMRFNFGRLPW